MPIFKLKKDGDDLANSELVEASRTNLNLEMHLESWLEKSPWAIAQEPILVIGRQTTAHLETGLVFPDLLGIDKDGNVVLVELKRGRTPRETVAQLLEYAAWASELSDEEIKDVASEYFQTRSDYRNKQFGDAFMEAFEAEEVPSLNQKLRLFVAAEEISPSVSQVCRFLRMSHGVDVNCIKFSVYQTESGEILVSSEAIVGQEEVIPPKKPLTPRWSGEKPVRQIVWETAEELTKGDKSFTFSPKDVAQVVLQKYPSFNKSTVGCVIISDCVNHTSRHHYPGGEDRYWWIEKGKYRLFDRERDKAE